MGPSQSIHVAPSDHVILAVNGGSSSIKFAAFRDAPSWPKLLSGALTGIGEAEQRLSITSPNDTPPTVAAPEGAAGGAADQSSRRDRNDKIIQAPDSQASIQLVLETLRRASLLGQIAVVGHRVVYGGPRLVQSQVVADDVLAELRRVQPLDPDHLPREIALIEMLHRQLAPVPQVAVFDTAFFQDLPRVARLLAIPRRLEAQGVHRYGFHGISYTFLMQRLAEVEPGAASGRVILAHLGAGASLAAIKHGCPLDTTMGFTPTAGIPMATRSGDMDPGVLVYLMRHERMTAEQINRLVNRQSGLLGVSETTGDMRQLLDWRATDERAAEAVDLFCYQVRKTIGAFSAVLGGLDTLVFSGGIGQHAPAVRAACCKDLRFLGLALDAGRNLRNEPIVSTDAAAVKVRVIATDEELVLAREAARVCALTKSWQSPQPAAQPNGE